MLNRLIYWARPAGRRVLSALRPRLNVRVQSFDTLFPDVEKIPLMAPMTVETPELAHATCVPGVSQYETDVYETPGAFAAVLHDVLYCPFNNVVLTEDGCVLGDSMSTIRRAEYLDHHALSARRVTPIKGPAAPLRSRFNHYYHTLVDHAPRLYLLSHPFFRSFGRIDLLLRDGPSDLEQLLISRMAPHYVRPLPLKRRRLYRVETFLFISFVTRRHAGFLPPEYRAYFQEHMLPHRPREHKRRIYVSRNGNMKGRRVLNEEEVVRALSPLGFEAFQLENLSLNEQIDLFYDAEAIVGPHGAGLSNLIYSQGALVVEWFSSHHVVPSFYFLSKSLNHKYERRHAGGRWRDDDMMIDISELQSILHTHFTP